VHRVRYWERVLAEAERQVDAIRQVLSGADEIEDRMQEASE
jgi:hypothetical protein